MARVDRDQLWRRLPDGTMELVEERIVERTEPDTEPDPMADVAALAEAVDYLLSTHTAAQTQTLRQRVAEIIERRRR